MGLSACGVFVSHQEPLRVFKSLTLKDCKHTEERSLFKPFLVSSNLDRDVFTHFASPLTMVTSIGYTLPLEPLCFVVIGCND